MLRDLENAFQSLWRSTVDRVPSILMGLLVLLLFWLGSRGARSIVQGVGSRTHLAPNLVALLQRVISFVTMLFGVLVAAVVIFPSFQTGDLFAGLGLTSVAVGFAFKDIFQNFFAGIFLLWRQPFKVGDEIRAAGFEGTVEEVTARSTRIRTYDGERAVIPNADVYTQSVLVRTAFGNRRSKLIVGIGYSDAIEGARSTIHRVLEAIDGVLKEPEPWVYVSELAPSSVNLTVYYWTDDAQREALRVSDRVATGIKLALDAAGIDMPYPHEVVLFHDETKR
ncbi:mechanosensitive ion channel family protein [bacterium]|nr:MAG: mechanosensitive ion channel family protein [bacterium]